VAFPVVQTYSNGKVSAWVEPVTDPANPPESPTAILTLHAATAAGGAATATATTDPASAAPAVDLSSYATKSDADTGRTLGVVGLVVGIAALVVGGLAWSRSRRTRAE
jgi:hypothetical protein